ncbi:MAG: hypothetical protein IT195_12460 [Microthrixaceae bacterium]|nr:hypothetical protein [Microthrixaceae bacterium]
MIPNNTPAGTPIVHTWRDGHRRAGTLAAPCYRCAAGYWHAPIRYPDGTTFDVFNQHIGCDPVTLANPAPPQLALFELE